MYVYIYVYVCMYIYVTYSRCSFHTTERFSKVSCTIILHSKSCNGLTFENFYQEFKQEVTVRISQKNKVKILKSQLCSTFLLFIE